MTKQQKNVTPTQVKSNESGFSFGKFIPEKYQTPALLLLILLLILIFFSPITFGDKTTQSGDLIQVKSLREYATKDRDGFSLWNPYIFGGMPAVATSMSLRWFDLTASLYSYTTKVYSSFFSDYNAIYTFSFIILAFTSFMFMRRFGASRSVSFLVATATIFSTGILLFFYIGHITKLMSLAIFPFILMMLFKFQKEIKLIDFFLFVFGLHILVLGAHVQIVFYFAFTAMIYFIYFFIRSFVIKDKFLQRQLLKSLGVTAAAGLIALLMSFDTYSQLYEYKPYSTRGTKSLTEKQNPDSPIQSESYEYATSWSFSPGEVLTFIVPSYYGFGNSTYNGPLSQNQDAPVNTYFGQMRSVDMPMYMGVIIFVLGLFTFFVRWKEPVVQFFGIVVLLFLLISFGNNFPVIYNLMYHYFPAFNNFRAPSMILTVLQITFPILAGLGVMKIISLRDEKNAKIEKVLRNISILFAGMFLLSLVLSGSISNWFIQRINDHAAALGQSRDSQMFTALSEYMADMFKADLMIALALISVTFGLCYAYITSKLKKEFLVAGLAIFILFDLFRIGNRGAGYIEASQMKDMFSEPSYISVIKKQKDTEPYRLVNLKLDGSFGTVRNNGNFNVYFLQEDLSGYSAVKPRSYQDIIDAVTPANFTLWKMLGVKYIITDKVFPLDGFNLISDPSDTTTYVYRNEFVLPRVYFVDSVAQKPSVEILNGINENSFNPQKIAFVDNLDFKYDKGDSTSTSKIILYKDEHVVVDVEAKGNNFLFFGSTYFPHGWKALINGAEANIHRTNYGFQGVVVPNGKHKVEFIYEPKTFVLGKYLSLILNLLMFGGLGFVFYLNRKKRTQDN